MSPPAMDMQTAMEKLSLNEPLNITGYTVGEALNLLRQNIPELKRALANGSDVAKVTATDIGDGKGFVSRVFRVLVSFEDGEELSCMMKIPTADHLASVHKSLEFNEEELKKANARVLRMHNVECEIYALLGGIRRFPIPQVYYHEKAEDLKKPGLILMEDLSDGATSLGIFPSVTEQHCLHVAEHIAVLQAHVETLPRESWRGKYSLSYHTGELAKGYQKIIQAVMEYSPKSKHLFDQFMPLDLQRLTQYCLVDHCADALTMTHGDLWTNNILMRQNPDGSTSNQILAYIDWQTVFEANPLLDVARFVVNCADADIRRDIERKVVDRYYDTLLAELAARQIPPKFTRAQAHEFYELAALEEALVLFFMFSLIVSRMDVKGKKADEARAEKLYLRLTLAVEDGLAIMRKYGLEEMCAQTEQF